jgi:predicted TIM-barrel fold metal-dependent hydrolase
MRGNLTLEATRMIIDFQHHYTPPELMEPGTGDGNLRLDETGNPNYRFNPLLANLPAHVRMMDKAGIDAAVLSCGSGFDQSDPATCRLINDRMHQAELDYPGRFIGLAHVPALNPQEALAELRRWRGTFARVIMAGFGLTASTSSRLALSKETCGWRT